MYSLFSSQLQPFSCIHQHRRLFTHRFAVCTRRFSWFISSFFEYSILFDVFVAVCCCCYCWFANFNVFRRANKSMYNIVSHCIAHTSTASYGGYRHIMNQDGTVAVQKSHRMRWLVPDLVCSFFSHSFIFPFPFVCLVCIRLYRSYWMRTVFGISYVYFPSELNGVRAEAWLSLRVFAFLQQRYVYIHIYNISACVCVCGGCARENDYFIYPLLPHKIRCTYLSIGMLCCREKQTHKLYTKIKFDSLVAWTITHSRTHAQRKRHTARCRVCEQTLLFWDRTIERDIELERQSVRVRVRVGERREERQIERRSKPAIREWRREGCKGVRDISMCYHCEWRKMSV